MTFHLLLKPHYEGADILIILNILRLGFYPATLTEYYIISPFLTHLLLVTFRCAIIRWSALPSFRQGLKNLLRRHNTFFVVDSCLLASVLLLQPNLAFV